ncbi:MAG: UDP-N-acetylmuramate dehydrogenase [Clostridiales bacterium]|nr:UDP-N-acetylmuramate dehydrogenase [Clostridiales bacterium]
MDKNLTLYLTGLPDTLLLFNEPMSRHTTFGIGGPAEVLIQVNTKDAARAAARALKEYDITPCVIGNGSNILVSDEGIRGAVMKICCGEYRVSGNTVYAGAGATLNKLAAAARDAGLSGLEFAYGIPGTVGGAVYMNAGAYGGQIADVLRASEYLDGSGKAGMFSKDEHGFGYRDSVYMHGEYIILEAEFALNNGEISEIDEKMRDYLKRRRDSQPLELPSAGSVFKRPAGNYAGALIEKCGLKGSRIGGAEVSEKHAGFIVNRGGATCEDVKRLIEHIRETVLREYGIMLECEIRII